MDYFSKDFKEIPVPVETQFKPCYNLFIRGRWIYATFFTKTNNKKKQIIFEGDFDLKTSKFKCFVAYDNKNYKKEYNVHNIEAMVCLLDYLKDETNNFEQQKQFDITNLLKLDFLNNELYFTFEKKREIKH